VKDIPVMIGAAVAAALLAWDASIGRADGMLLLASCAAYLGFLLRAELKSPAAASEEIEVFDPAEERSAPSIGRDVLRIALGLVALVVGARLLVSSATFYAQMLGVSDLVIGLTVVAIGTSLPELSTSVMAAMRGHSDLALGNVIGSNVMNILLILGVTAVIHPLPADPSMFNLEIPVMVGISILLLPLARRGLRITRWNGVLLVLAYVGFLAFLFGRGAL
jgi:cation:H+ antiporter